MSELTHFNQRGEVHMVDVGSKDITHRTAVAEGRIRMTVVALEAIMSGETAKGDALATARIAGIMAAKKTPELIPLCHPLLIDSVEVDFAPDSEESLVKIEARVRVNGRTGVEMEALTAASIAALTIYDMCKAVDKAMTITDIYLLKKTGGKSGTFTRPMDDR